MADYDVFISHSSQDQAAVERLVDYLEGKAKLRCWWSAPDIPPGANWPQEIERRLRECEVFVCYVTSNVIKKTDQIVPEIMIAKNSGKLILPFMAEDVNLGAGPGLELALGVTNRIDATRGRRVDDSFPRLANFARARVDEVKQGQRTGAPPQPLFVAPTPPLPQPPLSALLRRPAPPPPQPKAMPPKTEPATVSTFDRRRWLIGGGLAVGATLIGLIAVFSLYRGGASGACARSEDDCFALGSFVPGSLRDSNASGTQRDRNGLLDDLLTAQKILCDTNGKDQNNIINSLHKVTTSSDEKLSLIAKYRQGAFYYLGLVEVTDVANPMEYGQKLLNEAAQGGYQPARTILALPAGSKMDRGINMPTGLSPNDCNYMDLRFSADEWKTDLPP